MGMVKVKKWFLSMEIGGWRKRFVEKGFFL